LSTTEVNINAEIIKIPKQQMAKKSLNMLLADSETYKEPNIEEDQMIPEETPVNPEPVKS
jgi:hypothetical protein